MNEPYTIDIIDDEFYSTHFSLSSKAFEERIYLYAECSKNPDFRKQDDYYFLELFFSVGSYGAREFLVGLNFGQAKMDKETLDHRIRSYLSRLGSRPVCPGTDWYALGTSSAKYHRQLIWG